ncbi:ribonuclease HII [Staphylococcus sp. Marseille-Q5304]|uniref:ribonuclease HII n=1 Tax=Staphylococcus sp. Marseille-Q5304 TaxID=2942200 RepID=UPI002072E78C|nr:ribonuclease HII [Staphylococcus sp. Marseille-Q5304]
MTIKEIKGLLQSVYTINEIQQLSIYNDQRKGVQQAIKSRVKQLEQQQRLLEEYETMSQFENNILKNDENALICGIDEVGRGPLAGPVVACAVILNEDHAYTGLNDSKKLSHVKRQHLERQLTETLRDYAYGYASVEEIDSMNIYEATKVAMKRAIDSLKIQPTHLLIDAMELDVEIEQQSLIKGDSRSVSIAAASVLAKEHRDRYMRDLGERYPEYGFERNAGYGTKQHLEAIRQQGVLAHHRKSFEPIRSLYKNI